jgi:gamma-glutamyl hercynylcysteine S-oxide synthase
MLAAQNAVAVPQELSARLADARQRTDELFGLVRPDSLYDRPIPERHRIVFYIGHLEAFDWNLLGERVFGLKSFHPEFDRLFAFGIDPVGGGLPDDEPSDWPARKQVDDYAAKIRQLLDESLGKEISPASSDDFPLSTLLNVAIEHRLMHAETLAYMLHQLPLDRKARPAQTRSIVATQPLQPRMIEIPAGMITLGLERRSAALGWDNEYEAHAVNVPAFAIDQYKVTNRQYLEFLRAGGYQARDLWSDDDWNWITGNNISHPIFWKRSGDTWLYRGMFDEVPLPLDAPVYVSHAEATAYSRWVGKDLPTEAEWQRTAYGSPNGSQRPYPWGNTVPNARLGNFDFASWDPTPVNSFPDGNSAFGVADLAGNGWEWTSTPFAPFPGFAPFSFYRGYSADFFDGKHFTMKGGSARTAACMLRGSFRNWFQPHYQYVYAGFRCVSR